MTWVVAGKHMFCARAISDVQVTLNYQDGTTRYFDAVKKTHSVGDKIVVLFSGSIRVAFAIVDELRASLAPRLDARLYERPYEVAKKLEKSIRFYYKKHCPSGAESVQFIVLISPNHILTGFGMWKLESPSFKLIGETKPFEMLQIGSGAVVPEYKDIVERNSVGVYMIDNGPGELPDVLIPVGRVAAKWVFSEALEYQNAGISRAMHITLMLHDEILVHPLPEVPEGSFPSVASSWKELTKLLGGKGIKLAGCQALA